MASALDPSATETHFSRRLRLLEPDCEARQARFLQKWADWAKAEPEIYGALTKTQVDVMARRSATTTEGWLAEGDIFSVPTRQGPAFFAFQFRDGEPHPAIKQVLEVLPSKTDWQTAFWFGAAHSALQGQGNALLPARQLDNPAIIAAAREDGKPAGRVVETMLTPTQLAQCLSRAACPSAMAPGPA
jgi:hypothetical protein